MLVEDGAVALKVRLEKSAEDVIVSGLANVPEGEATGVAKSSAIPDVGPLAPMIVMVQVTLSEGLTAFVTP